MPSECGLTSALLTGIGDARIRQRMEACQQGIVQLDSLRQKHSRLMDQLRSQYPDFATPPIRSPTASTTTEHLQYSKTLPPITESPPTSHRYESTTLPQPSSSSSTAASTSLPTAMNAAFATRCETASPLSACMSSHRSSVSIDSGYTSISSDPFLCLSSTPMSYSAFRKKAATLERPPHTSTSTAFSDQPTSTSTKKEMPTIKNNNNNNNDDEEGIESTSEKMIETTIESTTGAAPMRNKRDDTSWRRPRSMYAMISSNNNNNYEDREEEKEEKNSGDIKDKEKESFANVSVASTARKLLDTSTFSQITPPPMSRKFATLQKTPPKPLPRSIYPPSQHPLPPQPSARSLSASSSALHHEPSSQPASFNSIGNSGRGLGGFVNNRPPPQFAKFDSAIQLQNAKVYAPIQSSPKLAQSATSAFTAKTSSSLKPGSTPPTKPRGNNFYSIPHHHQPQPQTHRPYIVPILASAKESIPPRYQHHQHQHRPSEVSAPASLHSAQVAAVLSRQQSYETNSIASNSPLEIRKMFISTPHTISRYGNAATVSSSSSNSSTQNVNRYTFEKSQQQQYSTSNSNSRNNRREKFWHESEGL